MTSKARRENIKHVPYKSFSKLNVHGTVSQFFVFVFFFFKCVGCNVWSLLFGNSTVSVCIYFFLSCKTEQRNKNNKQQKTNLSVSNKTKIKDVESCGLLFQ